VARRYQGELATVAELLEAQATETASTLTLSHARYLVRTSAAALLQAAGADPGTMTMLDGVERSIVPCEFLWRLEVQSRPCGAPLPQSAQQPASAAMKIRTRRKQPVHPRSCQARPLW